jgi:hypothetical protein
MKMAQKTDWLPSSHQDRITMARNWVTILNEATTTKTTMTTKGTVKKTAKPKAGATKADKWEIPPVSVTTLADLTTTAEEILIEDQDPETKTKVTTQKMTVAIRNLIAKMRDIKKRYFYIPPLTEDDLVSLGLNIPDTTPTKTEAPTAEVTIEYWRKGEHEIGFKIIYLTGSADDKANKGYRIWYKVLGAGDTAPTNPKDLNESFFTKKKKDIIVLDTNDSGKKIYCAVQIENEGKKGPWGPITQAIIP